MTVFVRTIFLIFAIVLVMTAVGRGRQLRNNFSLEFSERFRFLAWDNAVSLASADEAGRTFTRHRTSLGGRWRPLPEIELHLKLTNEFRYYFVPENPDIDFDEIFFDQLYVKTENPFRWPLSLTVGRQNIMLGEMFMVMDGHPLDGSRSIYFNAVRLDWTVNSRHKITALGLYQTETDRYLPVINDRDQALVEQPEAGYGLYYTGHWRGTGIDIYGLVKKVKSNAAYPTKSTINTVGGRLDCPVRVHLDYVIEAAYQFGRRNDSRRAAFGGYSYFRLRPAGPADPAWLPKTIRTGGLYLSGDDPDTENWEDWDPMFARWPKWSESYIYTQIKEDRVAYWTNLASLFVSLGFSPDDRIDFRLDYHHLMAPRHPPRDDPFPGGDGKTRGDLIMGKLIFAINDHWSGHILWEGFIPGDYYTDLSDGYNWLRTELMFRF